jgi:hypothetical protein
MLHVLVSAAGFLDDSSSPEGGADGLVRVANIAAVPDTLREALGFPSCRVQRYQAVYLGCPGAAANTTVWTTTGVFVCDMVYCNFIVVNLLHVISHSRYFVAWCSTYHSSYFVTWMHKTFISSPELKAQVSYSDRPLSIVRLSVRLSVCSSVRKLLHFRLLLQKNWANFNQT